MQGSAIKCVLVHMHRGKYLARSYLDPGSHTYERQGYAIAASTQHKWNAQNSKRAPSHGSLAWDLASNEDDCNSRMAVVYTKRGNKIMIITFHRETKSVPSTKM